MSESTEDRTNLQTNTTILDQEFNLNMTEQQQRELQEIQEMRFQLAEVKDVTDPDVILLTNIERANTLLDTAQQSITDGNTSPRLFEVCAQLINAITSAAASIQNSSFGAMKHEYNMEMVKVKKQEVAVKEALAMDKKLRGGDSAESGRVVLMTRESLLNMMKDSKKEVEIQSHGTETTEEI